MRKIIRVTNPESINYLKGMLTPLTGQDLVETAERLKASLREHRERCFYLMVADDDQIDGFLLALQSGPAEAGIFQVAAADDKVLSMLMTRLFLWCEMNDLTTVKLSADNLTETLRRWGFSPVITMYELSVPENLEALTLAGVTAVTGEKNVSDRTTELRLPRDPDTGSARSAVVDEGNHREGDLGGPVVQRADSGHGERVQERADGKSEQHD